MSQQFLGKNIPPKPTLPLSPKPTRNNSAILFGLLGVIGLLFLGGSGAYQLSQTLHPEEGTVLGISTTKLAQNPPIKPASETKPATVNSEEKGTTSDCHETSPLLKGQEPYKIFPVIPENYTYNGQCPPPYWNLSVVRYFMHKTLAALQWTAYALAIVLTIYAGLLYITGFANEANTKTAKTMLIATYTGLVFVILSRAILFGTIQLIIGGDYNPYINDIQI